MKRNGRHDFRRAWIPGVALTLALLGVPGAVAQEGAADATSVSRSAETPTSPDTIEPIEETGETGRYATPVEIILDHSLHGSADSKEPGFLYFDDTAGMDATGPTITVDSTAGVDLAPRVYFTPRSGSGGLVPGPIVSGSPSGSFLGGSGLSSLNGASSRVSISGLAGRGLDDPLSVALTSSVIQRAGTPQSSFQDLDFQLSPLDETVSLGLSLGYWGFNLDANVTREQGFYSGEVEGVDLGLGYSWAGFSTTVSVGEFRQNDLGAATADPSDVLNFYRMELGATYQLTRSFQLSGGVQHFEYGQEWRAITDRQRFQLLYLSGQFRF